MLRSVSYLKANLNTLRREKDEVKSGAAQAESTTMWVDKHVGGTEKKDLLHACLIQMYLEFNERVT